MANHDPLAAKTIELAAELKVLGRLLEGFGRDLEEAAFNATVAGSSFLNRPRRELATFLATLDAGLLCPDLARAGGAEPPSRSEAASGAPRSTRQTSPGPDGPTLPSRIPERAGPGHSRGACRRRSK